MVRILPFPKECKVVEDVRIVIPNYVFTEKSEWVGHVETFELQMKKVLRVDVEYGKGGFVAAFDGSLAPDEYVIDSTSGEFYIYASDKQGLMYGFASVLQMIDVREGQILKSKKYYIKDRPDKEYRSLMVDLSRNWHPFPQLLKYVDLCFFYKVNYLHLHFIDDPRYTLPSKIFPNLPTKGESYTEEQIKQLNEYASARGINIVPEFECPGHARSINDAYPEIFANESDGEGGKFYNEQGAEISAKSLLCAGSQKAFEATLALLKEVSDLFPNSKYLHIGGDEATIALWNQCPHCRSYMEKNGIKDVYEMYSDYVGRVTDYVLSLGKIPMVWEGFPKSGSERVSKKTVVIAWESHYHFADDLLDEGFEIINASWQPLYIVPSLKLRWLPEDILRWNVYNWQHWWDQSRATLNPITVPATDKVRGSILCAWEMTYEQEVSRVMENLIAMNERVWNVERRYDDEKYNWFFHSGIYGRAANIMLYS